MEIFLKNEINLLAKVFSYREGDLNNKITEQTIGNYPISSLKCAYSDFLITNNISFEERLLIILVLIPHIQPDYLRNLLKNFQPASQNNFMTVSGDIFKGLLPTAATFCYLLAGSNLGHRLFLIESLYFNHYFCLKNKLIAPIMVKEFEPLTCNPLIINKAFLILLLTNKTLQNHG